MAKTRIKCIDQHLLNGSGLQAACIVEVGVLDRVVVRKVPEGFQWIEFLEACTPGKITAFGVNADICPLEELPTLLDEMRDFAPLRMWSPVDPNNIDFPIPVEVTNGG